MNKKFLSAVLFGALMVTSTGTFVSCKDYDDDIDQLRSEVVANKEAIKKLQDLMGEGKFVTGVTKSDAGLVFTMSNGGTSITIPTSDGKDGTIVTISEDGYWVLDGKKTTVKAKGDTGATGETGAPGKDAKSPKINATTGNWEIWDVTKGEYVDSGHSAIGAQTYVIVYDNYYELNVMEQDANGKNLGFKSIKLPISGTLYSIDPQFASTDGINIYYGLLTQDVNWKGNKAVDGKMLKGMYPTTDRDIKMLLNPTDVDANAYDFAFVATDNTTPWGLNFSTPTPWTGKATTETRAVVTSENGVWALPRNVQKIDLTDVQGRPDYALQFKKNDGEQYLFALKATSKIDAKKAVLSSYDYKFKASNVNSNEDISINGLTFAPSGRNFIYNKEYKPTFDMFNNGGDFTAAEDSALVYDYYLEIDKSAITDESIRKYGLEITADGYRFIAKKEAVVNNTVQFIYNYILINGKTGSTKFKVNFNDEEASVADQFIGNFTAPFNAEVVLDEGGLATKIHALNHTFSLDKFFEGLGTAGKLKWTDAIARSISAAGATTDPKEINKFVFDKKESGTDVDFNVELLGGDPINNSGIASNVEKYNAALLDQYIEFDYVDAEGKSCLTGNLRDLDKIVALKVTFKADENTGKVGAPYYTSNGLKYSAGTNQKIALPLDNAFRVAIATRYDQYEVSKMNFSFELTMPENCPIERKSVGNDNSKWGTIEEEVAPGKKESFDLLTVYGEKDVDHVNVDMRDAFTGAFVVTKTENPVNNTYSYAYGAKKTEAKWYEIMMDGETQVNFIGQSANKTAAVTLDGIVNNSSYNAWNTKAPIDVVFAEDKATRPVMAATATYYHFGVYTEKLPEFRFKFGNKIEEGSYAMTGKGTAATPIIAVAKYTAATPSVLTHYEVEVDDDFFTMKDAFGKAFSLFDDATKRSTLHMNLIEDRNGLMQTPDWYGLNPSARVDTEDPSSKVTFTLMDGTTPINAANFNTTNKKALNIKIDKSVGNEKTIEVTLKVTDVFAGHANWTGSQVVKFYVRTNNANPAK